MISIKRFLKILPIKLFSIVIIGFILSLISGKYSILFTSFLFYVASLVGSTLNKIYVKKQN